MMKKEIIYNLQGVCINLGMTYKTTKKLKFGSNIFIDGTLWRVVGIN